MAETFSNSNYISVLSLYIAIIALNRGVNPFFLLCSVYIERKKFEETILRAYKVSVVDFLPIKESDSQFLLSEKEHQKTELKIYEILLIFFPEKEEILKSLIKDVNEKLEGIIRKENRIETARGKDGYIKKWEEMKHDKGFSYILEFIIKHKELQGHPQRSAKFCESISSLLRGLQRVGAVLSLIFLGGVSLILLKSDGFSFLSNGEIIKIFNIAEKTLAFVLLALITCLVIHYILFRVDAFKESKSNAARASP